MKVLRFSLSVSLCLTFITFVTPSTPANAAACSVTYGTVSGATRFAKFTSGSSCTWVVPANVTSLQYLVVGGGGGGGGAASTTVSGNLGGGGGGGGGIVNASTLAVSAGGTVTLTIGIGGTAGSAGSSGGNGGTSSLIYSSTTVSSSGGNGGGGSPGTGDVNTLSGDGGANTSYSGGASVWDGGGGGAGSAANGTAGTDIGGQGGNGGAGGTATLNTLLGSNNYYGGGGGGGGTPSSNSSETDGTGAAGGSSVGGTGGGTVGGVAGTLATAGAANTGSGGGGGGWRSSYSDTNRAGGAGADGVIIIVFTKNAGSVSSVAITSNSGTDNTYKTSDVITATVYMSETATVTGTPRMLILGLTTKYFTYSSGSGTPNLTFTYTVLANDSATSGIGIGANALDLNSGTLLDTAGLAFTITHALVAQASNQRVDGILPSLVGVTQSFSVPENETRTINLTTSETATLAWAGVYDRAYFILNTSTTPATLTITARDFENKLDYDANNVYYVGITLTDLAGNATGSYNFNITITDVVESAVVGIPSLSASAKKGIPVTISITSDVAGKADFYWNGKRIAGCIGKSTTGSSPNISATCSWKPTSTAVGQVYATIRPTNVAYSTTTSPSVTVVPTSRGTMR